MSSPSSESWSRRRAPAAASERGDRGVQRGARPHRGRCLGIIGQIVTADVDRLALRADQFGIDLGLVLGERLGQRLEAGLQRRVLGLRSQRLSPVQGEVEMAAAIVDFADLARGIAVELEELADGRVERLGENLRLGILVGSAPDVRATRRGRGTRRANPNADSPLPGTAARAWAPSRRRRSRTCRRPPTAERSTASWTRYRAP